MSDVQQQSGRRGGRAARVALRSAPLANDVRPVNPGMPSGRYQPLTDAEVRKVHESVIMDENSASTAEKRCARRAARSAPTHW